jgi:hypothetical protein
MAWPFQSVWNPDGRPQLHCLRYSKREAHTCRSTLTTMNREEARFFLRSSRLRTGSQTRHSKTAPASRARIRRFSIRRSRSLISTRRRKESSVYRIARQSRRMIILREKLSSSEFRLLIEGALGQPPRPPRPLAFTDAGGGHYCDRREARHSGRVYSGPASRNRAARCVGARYVLRTRRS